MRKFQFVVLQCDIKTTGYVFFPVLCTISDGTAYNLMKRRKSQCFRKTGGRQKNMYADENDVRLPRERVDDATLERLLGERGMSAASAPVCCGCGGMTEREDQTARGRNVGLARLENGSDCGETGGETGGPGCTEDHECVYGCGAATTWGLEGYPLAIVYSPLQEWINIYDEMTALERGTLFAELDKPLADTDTKCKGGTSRG